MDSILERLKAKAQLVPTSTLLKDTISLLEDLQRNPDIVVDLSWDTLRRDFAQLQEHGLWERSKENDDLLRALWDFLETTSSKASQATQPSFEITNADEGFSMVLSPSQSLAPQLISSANLPLELMEVLNKTYFLHLLATDPGQVLPPGKSLLSVMSRPHRQSKDSKPALQNKVEDLVRKAFWDKALDSLSSPEPATQLARLKLLYVDVQVALSHLLPHKHPVLEMLSPPLPPTTSPLESALSHLREVLTSMQARCAPVRDAEIEAEQRALDNPPIRTTRPVALATLVLRTIRFVLECSEAMKDDLSQFVLGSMSEQQIGSVIAKQAKMGERQAILHLWHRDHIVRGWQSWLGELRPTFSVIDAAESPRLSWIVRLVQALGNPSVVKCPLPKIATLDESERQRLGSAIQSTSVDYENVLPPIFLFSIPTIVKLQNYLQALVIAATLRTLTPPLSTSELGPADPTSFTERVWVLLRADIAEERDASGTKLVNLADEVIRAHTHGGGSLPKERETKLREAVAGILKSTSRVFVLLQNRLLTALVTSLVRPRVDSHPTRERIVAPEILKSGQDIGRDGKRPRLVLDSEDMDGGPPQSRPLKGGTKIVVQGFDDPVLSSAMADVFVRLDDQLKWLESLWGDLIEAES